MGKVKEAVREHLPFFEQRYQFPMGKVKEGNVPEKLANNKYQFPMGKVKKKYIDSNGVSWIIVSISYGKGKVGINCRVFLL